MHRQNYFDVTDEPSEQIPFMYHYADRPGLSTQRSREIIAQSYNTSVNGIPGNDGTRSVHSTAQLMRLIVDALDRLGRDGELCFLLSGWNVPGSRYSPISPLFAFLPGNFIRQPLIQLNYNDQSEQLPRKPCKWDRWDRFC